MTVRSALRFALWLALGVGAAACGPREITDGRRYVLQTWGESLLRRNYAAVRDEAAGLARDADVYAASPTAMQLDALKGRWQKMRRPWERAELFGFGPNTESPTRFSARLDFWPTRPADIEAAVGKADNEETLGASETGLPVLEYLLFAADSQQRLELDAQRRRYLGRVARDVAGTTEKLFDRWDPHQHGYYRELIDAGRDSEQYASLQDALQEMLRQVVFMLDVVQMKKLQAPLGDGTSHPELCASGYSGRSLDDIRDNLRGVEIFYFGDGEWVGLDWYLSQRGREFGGSVEAALQAARDALDSIDAPLTQALETEPKEVARLAQRVSELKRLFEVDIISSLSLSIGYAPADAD